ncbi:L-type lectin-domain containing receptor kinase IX.1 [Acorus calamus]|uniref:non-specific serine/threonine protein kinase n=1 Tax=Acorus calamus TaxID=4465 RepID=A0AAV9CRU6_ACOCL|nr:L-type lectin-domain containing receptor kinase IX.1 [Acorus calamus]
MAFHNFHYICILIISLFFPLIYSGATAIHFNFSSFDSNGEILYLGDAFASKGVIQLTTNTKNQDSKGSSGRAIFNQPVPLWDSATKKLTDFTTHFTFSVETDSSANTTHGDGFTFFLVPNGSYIPPESGGGLLGMSNSTEHSFIPFVAVEFDTYQNGWDLTQYHIGIDINSMKSVVDVPWKYLFNGTNVANAWVVYNASLKKLSVFSTYDQNPTFEDGNATLYDDIDLGNILPESVYVGFSATTGTAVEFHNILSWSFDSTLDVTTAASNQTNTASNSTSPGVPQIKTKSWFVENVGVVVIVSVVTAALILGVFWWSKRKRGTSGEGNDIDMEDDVLETERGPRKFPYSTLSAATNNFISDQKLGEGAFGEVYRGFLKDLELDVAIKKVSASSKQGKKEYLSEVKIISRLRHRNLVQLIGYCHDNGRLLLVYELVSNRSLDSHIFGSKGSYLSLADRQKIALGLASALMYLHEEWTQCVLHRDIKSSNVMLDSNFEAKLGDFGLARLVDHDQHLLSTDVAGTRGYLAPECYYTGKASKESDVYSFGVVVLEIVCGRRSIDLAAGEGKVELVKWVWQLYGTGEVLKAADEKLGTDFDARELERLMIVGLWCAHPDYAWRPSIGQAIGVLKSEAPLPELPSKLPVPLFAEPSPGTGQSMNSYSASYSSSSGTATASVPMLASPYSAAR